ncbi:ABC transporter permease [Eubacterium sp. 1001713B170207_170306_E7]|uniref:ABC transporter permease n=1 Tax=Eubacterium sp. 1001713B170207_170306_E7 TaxID=2787097 RepID=UPI001898451C|nr:ABC transporter permease [Eubacterium sp. 1001713B170207_170306_E7]
MNLFKRAFLFITRKRGRSILLLLILFIMANLVLAGFAVRSAAFQAEDAARERLGGKFTLEADIEKLIEENNRNASVEESSRSASFEGDLVTEEAAEKIAANDGVRDYNLTANRYVLPDGFENLKPEKEAAAPNTSDTVTDENGNPVDTRSMNETFNNMLTFQGDTSSEKNPSFSTGVLKLTEGRHVSRQDENAVILHQALAQKNNLKVGDKIRLKSVDAVLRKDSGLDPDQTFEAEIVGLYTEAKASAKEMLPLSMSLQENTFFGSARLAAGIGLAAGKTPVYTKADFYAADPKNIGSLIEKARTDLPNLEDDNLMLSADDALYQKMAGSLENISKLVTLVLIIVAAVSLVILSLILTLWTRTRTHESGILLSLGKSKVNIIGQYVAEALSLTVIAFMLATAVGPVLSQATADYLIARESAAGTQAAGSSDSTLISAATPSDLSTPDAPPIDKIDVSLNAPLLLQVYAAGAAIVVLSVGFASISILRLKPKEILSKMS